MGDASQHRLSGEAGSEHAKPDGVGLVRRLQAGPLVNESKLFAGDMGAQA